MADHFHHNGDVVKILVSLITYQGGTIAQNMQLFFSSVAKLNVNLTEYFVTENCFRFTNGW